MKHLKLLMMTVVVATFAACGTTSTVPLTGRKHKISVSDEYILSLSNQEYSKFMASAKRSTDTRNVQLVNRVGRNLANAVETYLRNNGFANEIQNFQWEFNLVADKQANAFCMPGGKIVVYEGLLPYTQNEASLAIVLGHEIAHAVAKHSAEQMTKKQNQGIFTQAAGAILGATVGQEAAQAAGQIGSTYFSFRNLRYSRSNENEADYMGLIFAAMAGYDPQSAIPFWKRMAQSSGTKPIEMFSDHPSDATRIQNLERLMPEALKYYKPRTTVATPVAKTTKSSGKKTTATKRRR